MQAGYYLVFKCRQWHIKQVVKEKIQNKAGDECDLVCIELNSNNAEAFDWEDESEFCYNNCMYDVVYEKRLSNGIHHFFCIPDEDENVLNRFLSHYISRALDGSPLNNSHSSLVKQLLSIVAILPITWQLQATGAECVLYPSEQNTIAAAEQSIVTPPPEWLRV